MDIKRFLPSVNLVATGHRISELRRARGYSVRDLQAYFGFDAPQAIYKWQKGLSLPSVDNLLALSELLEVPMEQILVRNSTGFSARTGPEPDGSFFLRFSAFFRKLNHQFNDKSPGISYNQAADVLRAPGENAKARRTAKHDRVIMHNEYRSEVFRMTDIWGCGPDEFDDFDELDYDEDCEEEEEDYGQYGAYIGDRWVDAEDLPTGWGRSPDWWDDEGFGETYEEYMEHTD